MGLQKALKIATIALLLLLTGNFAALAENQQDYCIKCTNPDETYICRIASNSSQTQGKQFLCIMNIAKDHGHDSCSATAQSDSCSGVLVQYEVSGSAPPQIPAGEITEQPAPTPLPATQDTPKSEPRTLVEFTKQATKATKKGIKSAGRDTSRAIKKTGSTITHFTEKVGGNIKKATTTTLKCITSLFSNCASE